MAKKFKFIIAILVFMGLFSSVQAAQYPSNDTFQNKTGLDTIVLSAEEGDDPGGRPDGGHSTGEGDEDSCPSGGTVDIPDCTG
ncbi:MAG: hypothetical protein KAR84_01695 [Elusimicrobiales bacterium]|nr:hypothetical protein [Elusimicrobiales bacterium]